MILLIMRYNILLLLLMVSLSAFSQNSNDTISNVVGTNSIQVSISIDDLNALKSENDSLKVLFSELNKKYQKLSEESSDYKTKLSTYEIDVKRLKSDTTRLLASQREADKRLANIASNFLYIPYEAFSIEKIAIPAFNAIANAELKREHRIKYKLLCSYKQDIENILLFIEHACTELQKPFTKNANDIHAQFQKQSFYLSYHTYAEWSDTFLGTKIALIEKQLQDFDGNEHKVDFSAIKEELNKCLKTIEAL